MWYMQDISESSAVINPLINDTQNLTEDHLYKIIEDLQNKYFMAPNENLKNQIIELLDVYKALLEEKQQEKYHKEAISGQNSMFDELINIK